MSGYQSILALRRLESEVDALGFMLSAPRHGSTYDPEYRDMVAIKPKDQHSLPVYARDAELFVGTLKDLEQWLRGVKWARDYDRMLFGKRHEANRERREQDERNRQLMAVLAKTEKETQ
jgi:hypothetical protein